MMRRTLLLLATSMIPLAACSTPAFAGCTSLAWAATDKPIVEIQINGHTLRMLVDTGAEYDGWIKPDVAKALGLQKDGVVPSDGPDDPTGGLPFYRADEVVLGAIQLGRRRFAEMMQVGPVPQPFDGIIGNGLLAGHQAIFDYGRGELVLTDETLNEGQSVTFDHGVPRIVLEIGSSTVPVFLDTGNLAGALFVTDEQARSISAKREPVRRGTAHTVYGAQPVYEAQLASPVRFGETTLPVAAIRWPGAIESGQLGSYGLAGTVVAIDWRMARVRMGNTAQKACTTSGDK